MGDEGTDSTPQRRRLRRLTALVPAFAIAAAIFGILPGGVVQPIDAHFYRSDPAGGWWLVGWALAQTVVAMWARRGLSAADRPKLALGSGGIWVLMSLIVSVVWFLHGPGGRGELQWLGYAMWACIGGASLLAYVVVPILLI